MGALTLPLEQTLLIFAGIPAAVILIVAGLVYAGGRKSAKRYRPGRPYDYAPVWFTSTAQPIGAGEHGGEHGATQAALPGAARSAVAADSAIAAGSAVAVKAAAPAGVAVSAPGVTGGASDRW